MSIVTASIVPHPPVLIPQIGKENLERLKNTESAYSKLAKIMQTQKVDTIIIISPHGNVQTDVFSLNLSPEFSCNFEEFGDFSTKQTWPGDIGLTYRIREKLETSAPLQLISQPELDHGSAIPLLSLTRNLPNVKIMPLYYSGLGLEAHFKLGQMLKPEILKSSKKISVIASGDLSHRLTKTSPAGYSSQGKKFDKKLLNYLKKNNTKKIINLNEKLVIEAGECGLKSILILLGILDGINHKPQMLSYEYPFGVGYLVMNFTL